MSWLRHRKEAQESDKPELKPKNQILQTPESSLEEKEKLNPSERKRKDFVETLKVPNNPDKDKLTRKTSDGNASTEGDPTKGSLIKDRGNETQFEKE